MKDTTSSPPDIRYRILDRGNLPEVARLHGPTNDKRSEGALAWEYFDPDLVEPGIIVGAFANTRLVGTQAFIPYRALVHGAPALSYKSELTLLDPAFRGMGIFDAMYRVGIDACRGRGGRCIWGFTDAVKPFTKVGFRTSGPLFHELVAWRPLRFAWRMRYPKSDSRSETEAGAAGASLANLDPPPESEFSLVRDRAYLRHRYVNNPRRRIVAYDAKCGVLYSAGGAWNHVVYVSETTDPERISASIRRQLPSFAFRWCGVMRMCVHPRLGWRTVPGAVYVRRTSHMSIVFRWLDDESRPLPRFDIEEGYAEGLM